MQVIVEHYTQAVMVKLETEQLRLQVVVLVLVLKMPPQKLATLCMWGHIITDFGILMMKAKHELNIHHHKEIFPQMDE